MARHPRFLTVHRYLLYVKLWRKLVEVFKLRVHMLVRIYFEVALRSLVVHSLPLKPDNVFCEVSADYSSQGSGTLNSSPYRKLPAVLCYGVLACKSRSSTALTTTQPPFASASRCLTAAGPPSLKSLSDTEITRSVTAAAAAVTPCSGPPSATAAAAFSPIQSTRLEER